MNNKTRILFGLVSSLMFACGFVRAADQFDPIGRTVTMKQLGERSCTEACGGQDGGGDSDGSGSIIGIGSDSNLD